MTTSDFNDSGSDVDALVQDWLTIPDVAERIGVPVSRVHTMISDLQLASYRRGERRIKSVPALFLDEDKILESLKGTLSVLHDSGYSEEDAIRWLFTDDDSLPGRPIDALHSGKKTEIRRRAQSLAW